MLLCAWTHKAPGMRAPIAGRSPAALTLYMGEHGAPFSRFGLTLATARALPSTRPIRKPHTVGERCAEFFVIVRRRSKPVAFAPCPLPPCLAFTPSTVAVPPSAGPYSLRRRSQSAVCLCSRCPGSLAITSETVPALWPPPLSSDLLPSPARRLYAPPPPLMRPDL